MRTDGFDISPLSKRFGLDRFSLGRNANALVRQLPQKTVGISIVRGVLNKGDTIADRLFVQNFSMRQSCDEKTYGLGGTVNVLVALAGELDLRPAGHDINMKRMLEQPDIFIEAAEQTGGDLRAVNEFSGNDFLVQYRKTPLT